MPASGACAVAAVPGVDMANHSPEPSAQVRVRRSPGAVQGLAALEEVADPATCAAVAAEQSRFELVAARDIARQERREVTHAVRALWREGNSHKRQGLPRHRRCAD